MVDDGRRIGCPPLATRLGDTLSMAHAIRIPLAGIILALAAVPAAAQGDEARLRASVGAAATTGVGDQDPAWTASFGYRFAERLSLDIEMTHAEPRFPNGRAFETAAALPVGRAGTVVQNPITGVPPRTGTIGIGTTPAGMVGYNPAQAPVALTMPARVGDVDGQTVIVTMGVRYELPITGGRLRPYLAAGLGLARTDVDVDIDLPQPWLAAVSSPGGPAGFGVVNGWSSQRFAYPGFATTRTTVAASGGFGASLRLFKGISADMDVRYFRFDESNMTRLGGGVSYRF